MKDAKDDVDIGILKLLTESPTVARLAQKLEFYGIKGKPLMWITSFLSNRVQSVVVDAISSSPCEVTSGVSQGSFIGRPEPIMLE